MPILSNKPASILERVGMMRRAEGALAGSNDAYLPDGAKPALADALTHTEPRRECANPECSSGWTMPWRSRRRPVFEGRIACKGACVEGLIRAAIARERGDRRLSDASEPHRHRIPLGLIMLAQGWITHPQLQKALESQRANGSGRIGDWLVSECGLESQCVTRGLSVQWSCPVLTTDGFSPQSMAMALPRQLIAEYGVLPLRIAGSKILYLGYQDRLDASSAFAAERMSELRTESGMVAEEEYEAARSRLLSCSFPAVKETTIFDTDSLTSSIAAVLEQKQPSDARLVRLHQHFWLRIWMEGGKKPVAGTIPGALEEVNDFLFRSGAEA